ncbi:NADH-cytochrome b5 reductase-like [Linderina macrospora]|uniref:NADH-cytochrome b5 reductase-like n=1 Tax=Linderina macrospora TaxID=4868 RepID=A0ACC1J6M9_9FUNG|nr:NADH-cytochrome b5 reductase-like [Linderina macrospora]
MAGSESESAAVLALYEEIARAKKRAAERKKAKEEQAKTAYGSVMEGDQLVLKLPPPPLKPEADDCCNSGCTPCILDTYKETMDAYKSEVSAMKLNHQLALRSEVTDKEVLHHMGLQPGLLNPLKFTPVRVVSAQQLNSYSRLFILDADSSNFFLAAGEHIHIRATVDDDKKITRPFTPLMIAAPDGVIRPHLLIRLYDHGLSQYFRSLAIGDYVSVRGPVSTTGNLTRVLQGDAVLLIAGGSGIAPIFQILQFAHVNEAYRSKRIVLIQCAIEHTGAWLSKETAEFAKDMPQLSHHVFLSQDATATSMSTGNCQVTPGRLTLGRLRKIAPKHTVDTHAIICGPGSFNSEIKRHLEQLSIANIQLL